MEVVRNGQKTTGISLTQKQKAQNQKQAEKLTIVWLKEEDDTMQKVWTWCISLPRYAFLIILLAIGFEKYDKLGFLDAPPLTPYKNLGPVIWFWSIFKHAIIKQTNRPLDID